MGVPLLTFDKSAWLSVHPCGLYLTESLFELLVTILYLNVMLQQGFLKEKIQRLIDVLGNKLSFVFLHFECN